MKKLFLTLLILAFTVSTFGYSGQGPWDSPNNVAITGGTIDGTVIGGTTPAAGTFTTVTANTAIATDGAGDADIGTEALYFRKGYFGTGFSLEGATDNAFQLTLALVDPTTPDKTITFPDLTGTVGLSTNDLSFFTGGATILLANADLSGVTDLNIPNMSAAAGGFEDSPLSTDGTDVTLAGDFIFTSGKLIGTTGDPDLMTIADYTLTITGAHLATTYTATPVEDPVVFYDALDANDTDWYTGTNADAGASSDDPYEIRTNSTPGSGVLASIDPTSGSEAFRHHAATVLHFSDNVTHGGYSRVVYSATSGTLTGATDKIELNIPTGKYILMCQLHVKVAVTNDGDNTWSSELNDTAQVEVISAGSAAAKNTNINHRADADTAWTLTDAETDIVLTPQGADFTGGEIEAHCLAEGFDTWDAD